MELKEFIATTLGEIQSGVQKAIDETIKNGVRGAINPSWGGTNDINASLIQKVSFDIAVTIADEEKAGANGGIKVVGISIGGENQATTTSSKITRIQFTIPIVPPVTTVNK